MAVDGAGLLLDRVDAGPLAAPVPFGAAWVPQAVMVVITAKANTHRAGLKTSP